MKIEDRRKFILGLTWANCGWQVAFALSWNLGLRQVVEARWGEQIGALVQGVGCLLPTAVVAWVVLHWIKRIGLWP
jgi:hypothetical protein